MLTYTYSRTKDGKTEKVPKWNHSNCRQPTPIQRKKLVALAIMNLLSFSNDKQTIAQLFYPNLDDWKWGDDEINFAKTIWSIK